MKQVIEKGFYLFTLIHDKETGQAIESDDEPFSITKGFWRASSIMTRSVREAGVYTHQKTLDLTDDFKGMTLGKITMHGSALGKTIMSAGYGGLGFGILGTILFPPLVPLAILVGALSGLGDYDTYLEEIREKSSKEREKARQERHDAFFVKLSKIKGVAPVLTMGSDHVRLRIDIEQKSAIGVILSGHYSGYRLDALDLDTIALLKSTAPDQDTKDILEKWQSMALPQTPTSTKSHPGILEDATLLMLLTQS